LIPESLLDTAWQAYEQAVQRGVITLAPESAGYGDRLPGRFLNPHKRLRPFCRVAKHLELMHWLQRLLGHPAKLLQTIASHKGSQQAAHSDSIHMTTYPLGYLAAAWIAFEDIPTDSGPLEFYPGSHRLPYVFSHNLQISVEGSLPRPVGSALAAAVFRRLPRAVTPSVVNVGRSSVLGGDIGYPGGLS
jgi:hypothetical protein